ncbi:tetratricopeptide repeat protein [Mycolicibacterium cosmeticum]|uniref:tetratricopeptide repeat protein n=1 Tax=Mycolicibacterium cosmeticum TaxID=258533 RepID=UPI003204C65E
MTADDVATRQLRSLMPELDEEAVAETSQRLRTATAAELEVWLRSTLRADQFAEYLDGDPRDGAKWSLLASWVPDLDARLSALFATVAERFVDGERRRISTEFEGFDVLGDLIALFPDVPFTAVAQVSGSLRRHVLAAVDREGGTYMPGAIWSQERYRSCLLATSQIVGSVAGDPDQDPAVVESAVQRFQRAGFLHDAAKASSTLGTLYAKARDSRALAAMLAANELYRASGGDVVTSSLKFGEVWYTLGQNHSDDGDLDSAALAYQEAVKIFEAADDPEGACRSMVGMAGALWQMPNRNNDAVDLFAQAYRVARVHGYKLFQAVCAFNLANYPDRVGDVVDSLALLRESMALFGQLREFDAAGDAAMQLGLKLLSTDPGGDEALEAFRVAVGCYGVLEDFQRAAMAMGYVADVHRYAGRLERSLRTHYEAVDLNLKAGRPGLLAMNALDTAEVLQLMGRYRESEDLFIRALQLFATELKGVDGDVSTLERIASVKLSLASMYMTTGRYDAAYYAIDDAEKIYQRIDSETDRHVCMMMKAKVHTFDAMEAGTAGALAAMLALVEYTGAAAYFAKHQDTRHLADTLQGLAGFNLSGRNQSRLGEAEGNYREAMRLFSSMGDVHRTAECRLGLSSVLARTDRYAEALTELAQARATFSRAERYTETAQCDIVEARIHASRGAEGVQAALDLAIPAALYIDATRCQFRDPAARAAWSGRFADIREDLFRWASMLGDEELVAQLVETTVNSGVFATAAVRAFAQGTGFDVVVRKGYDPEPRTLDEDISPPTVDVYIRRKMSHAPDEDHNSHLGPLGRDPRRLIAGASLPASPPPPLRLPDGRVCLAQHRMAAAARYPTAVLPSDPVPIL